MPSRTPHEETIFSGGPGAGAPPKSRSGRFGFLDPDDPDAEAVIRGYAERNDLDPDELVREELATRQSRGRTRSLDEVLASERAKTTGTGGSAGGAPRRRAAGATRRGGRPRRAGSGFRPSLSPPRRWGAADGAGFLLGLFA